ncbi:lactonase family protein [Polaromonas jejuensis]|uniref:Lactonase family protein n=1 Tax=Polaromonas jejuensis TaxID=457502 RepID=A0ABW0QAK4_9BURK|nr:lactonase family protein [Polaromonas jejuensis]
MAGSCYRWFAYVGCRTTRERNARGKGLSVYGVHADGQWELVQQVEGLVNPSFLCLAHSESAIYAVHGDQSHVSSFDVDAREGTVRQTSEQDVGGNNPVHLALSRSQRWLLVANYATGNVVSLPVQPDGALGRLASSLSLPGIPGPHLQQKGAHPHQICVDLMGRWLFVPDKGLDKVFTLSLHEGTGELKLVSKLGHPPGTGPRHMVMHPRLPRTYVVGELDRTVATCRLNPATGELDLLSTTRTVPPGVESGSAAGIIITGKGQSLHVSNRGHDSVASFPVNADTGALLDPMWAPTGGATPRFISGTPDGDFLLAANEDADNLAIARLDANHPAPLTFQPFIQTESPVCVIFKKA